MRQFHNPRSALSLFLPVCLTVLSLTGCAGLQLHSLAIPFESLSSNGEKIKPTSSTSTSAQQTTTPQCIVDFRSGSKAPQTVQLDITDGMCVQDAIRESRALKKYKRITTDLYRKLPKGGWHKMEVPFDNRKDQVRSGYDYAIHPGDRLVVTEDTSTTLDRMLASLTRNVTKR